jgi:hypothetical protein
MRKGYRISLLSRWAVSFGSRATALGGRLVSVPERWLSRSLSLGPEPVEGVEAPSKPRESSLLHLLKELLDILLLQFCRIRHVSLVDYFASKRIHDSNVFVGA